MNIIWLRCIYILIIYVFFICSRILLARANGACVGDCGEIDFGFHWKRRAVAVICANECAGSRYAGAFPPPANGGANGKLEEGLANTRSFVSVNYPCARIFHRIEFPVVRGATCCVHRLIKNYIRLNLYSTTTYVRFRTICFHHFYEPRSQTPVSFFRTSWRP